MHFREEEHLEPSQFSTMFDWVGLLLRTGYYFGHVIGATNFELDWRTGRVFKSTRSTLYATAINFTAVIFFGWQFIEGETDIRVFGGTNKIYGNAVIIVAILRITAGLAVLVNQWQHQSQLMMLARNAIKLCLARPQIMRISRWRILFKFVNNLLRVIFPLLFALFINGFEISKEFSGLVLHLWISAILNMVIAQYFLVMVCVRAHYILLNTELQQVIEESRNLSCNPSRRGAFMKKCCTLADQLEGISKLQSQLQSIVDQSGAVFGVPKLVMYCCYYASAVLTSYTTYKLFKHGPRNLGMNLRDIIFTSLCIFFYHLDDINNLFMAFHVQDGHQKMIRLLDERTLFASGLDVRLEQSFEILQLQLIRNPLKLDVLHLFLINRKSTWAMFVSILLHSICLVQYDLENFKRN